MATSASCEPAVFDVSQRYVRVRGEKHGLIEFEFAIGDTDTMIELLMPPEAFRAFCRSQNARVLEAEPDSTLTLRLDPTALR